MKRCIGAAKHATLEAWSADKIFDRLMHELNPSKLILITVRFNKTATEIFELQSCLLVVQPFPDCFSTFFKSLAQCTTCSTCHLTNAQVMKGAVDDFEDNKCFQAASPWYPFYCSLIQLLQPIG